MTDKDIMEEISKSYLEVIANRQGYFNCTQRDYGTDMLIRKAVRCPRRGRYLTVGKAVELQVKAVSARYVKGLEDNNALSVRYRLEGKTFNDLLARSNENGSLIPLILAVFIMPCNKDDWILVNPEELIVKKCAFWYKVPPESSPVTTEGNKIAIEIPKENRISLSFYDQLFSQLD